MAPADMPQEERDFVDAQRARNLREAMQNPEFKAAFDAARERERKAASYEFLAAVLGLFAAADCRDDLWWVADQDGVRLFAWVNDAFMWGCADTEDIATDTLPALRQAYDDLAAVSATEYLAMLYAARQRQMRPQGASYPQDAASVWPLLDACGPERPTGFGNPHQQPKET